MGELHSYLIAKTMPYAKDKNFVKGEGFRITVLTSMLLRVEVQKDNKFTEEATQYIWNRNFPEVEYKAEKAPGGNIIITTKDRMFNFDVHSKKVTYIFINEFNKWVKCSNSKNLKGTKRTLDQERGRVKLGYGVLSRKGVAILEDDSELLVDGRVEKRINKEKDIYIFAYGHSYRLALNDYFVLTGPNPMLPRYVFGNWWSRYHKYTQQEYMDVMTKFEQRDLPFTIATVDMDWHWTDVAKRFGADADAKGFNPILNLALGLGWTGYTWNTELFPDYRAFLRWLHEHNYRVTLNLHPAVGLRPFEVMYKEMCEKQGLDPEKKERIKFDIFNEKYINNYMDVMHHQYETEGVDFWWIDWQQGRKTEMSDMDPLWALNHYHYLDNCRNKRGLILSRYCGIGSHRYPIGFSGDTVVIWRSFKFQPEFTNTASNIGYDWWSHDIGGHNFGITSDEMYVRWIQYGVFSPINRLHSSNFELQGKEPWKHNDAVNKIASDFLRLRHALIPYIYTCMYLTHTENRALCEPMYYDYPNYRLAYKYPNQYKFGPKLIVCPITSKAYKKINLAKVEVYLPEHGKRYTDIFTGQIYEGGQVVNMFRDLDTIPVLAEEGAIIPLSLDKGNSVANPESLKLLVYRGEGEFTLYEDDGETDGYKYGRFALTRYTISEKTEGEVDFAINSIVGDDSQVPQVRKYVIKFCDIIGGKLLIDGVEEEFKQEIEINVNAKEGLDIRILDPIYLENTDKLGKVNEVLSRYQGNNIIRAIKYMKLAKIKDPEQMKKVIMKTSFARCAKLAALEKLL